MGVSVAEANGAALSTVQSVERASQLLLALGECPQGAAALRAQPRLLSTGGAFAVRYTDSACEDLLRLFDFLIDRARTIGDLEAAQAALDPFATPLEYSLLARR